MRKIFLIAIIAVATCLQAQERIVILHTNDTHSCIEPEKNGNAGVLNRALLIEDIKGKEGAENVLLFDCGDFSQGSLYYNIFRGDVEIELMNAMGYNAGALGNHEFDFGLENLARLAEKANFPLLCSNYDFTGTPCEGVIKPWACIECNGIKIGVFALAPNPDGLIPKNNYKGVKFLSPIESARRYTKLLREKGCDIIICLSHLGYELPNFEYDDKRLATATSGIDLILGGHSHTYLEKAEKITNCEGKETLLQQLNKNGRYLGVFEIEFQ